MIKIIDTYSQILGLFERGMFRLEKWSLVTIIRRILYGNCLPRELLCILNKF